MVFVVVFHFHSGFQERMRLSDTRSEEVWVGGYISYKASLLLAKVFLFFKQNYFQFNPYRSPESEAWRGWVEWSGRCQQPVGPWVRIHAIMSFPEASWLSHSGGHQLILFAMDFPSFSKVPRPWASWVALVVKNPPTNAGDIPDMGLIPELGRSPGGGHGHPHQYSCLGAWLVTVHRVTE